MALFRDMPSRRAFVFLDAEKEAAEEQLWSEDAVSLARKIDAFPQDASDERFSFSDVYKTL